MTDRVCVLNDQGEECVMCVDAKGGRLACGYRRQNRVDMYRVAGSELLLMWGRGGAVRSRGSLRSGVEENGVMEMCFGRREKGSMLCVTWRSGHVLFYHLCYWCVCCCFSCRSLQPLMIVVFANSK